MGCFSLLFWNSFAHFTIYAVSSAKMPIKDYVCVNLCEQDTDILKYISIMLVWVVVCILMHIVSEKKVFISLMQMTTPQKHDNEKKNSNPKTSINTITVRFLNGAIYLKWTAEPMHGTHCDLVTVSL